MESLLGDEEVLLARLWVTAQKGHKFWPYRWIALKFLQEFLADVFLGLGMELLLGDDEIWAGQTKLTAKKGHNFWSDRWIALKF
jgi:hypothetical protein